MIRNQSKPKTDSFLNNIKPPTYINGIINTKQITPGSEEISVRTCLQNIYILYMAQSEMLAICYGYVRPIE